MSSSELAVAVSGLSKRYAIRHSVNDHITIAELAVDRLKHPLRRANREQFWALRDVDLEVRKGEVLGVIGRNGAGKSTLLKVLTRITEPSSGRVDLWGRVGSLLEVGTGFHPELTGRENIYLNGSILGMTRKEIAKQFDSIVDFAGVEKFLDTPVKRYSSGMYVRLAFAVAAHLETEILLVDEVLAVGDADFQNRCLAKMREVATDGRTVLLVSHNALTISTTCNKALLLDRGRVGGFGESKGVCELYAKRTNEATQTDLSRSRSISVSGEYRLVWANTITNVTREDEVKRFEFSIEKTSITKTKAWVSINVVDEFGRIAVVCDTRSHDYYLPDSDLFGFEVVLQGPLLAPGAYRLDAYICGHGLIDAVEDLCRFRVEASSALQQQLADISLPHTSTIPQFSVHSKDVDCAATIERIAAGGRV
ncbi:MAG: ABC-type polysaccharide/polyol phosphate transport system, ATPase component [Acidimicrobiales bacterium]|jgi:lipopolysaccharide transport system ATP-binding protein|nr:ABC-type polysaccharide/polyol phosphate transport system, ATPase component [Acidimicrobiales bacterium]